MTVRITIEADEATIARLLVALSGARLVDPAPGEPAMRPMPAVDRIRDLIAAAGPKGLRPVQISRALPDVPRGTVANALARMLQAGQIRQRERGRYVLGRADAPPPRRRVADTTAQAIAVLREAHPATVRFAEVQRRIGASVSSVFDSLMRAIDAGQAEHVDRGEYRAVMPEPAPPPKPNGALLHDPDVGALAQGWRVEP